MPGRSRRSLCRGKKMWSWQTVPGPPWDPCVTQVVNGGSYGSLWVSNGIYIPIICHIFPIKWGAKGFLYQTGPLQITCLRVIDEGLSTYAVSWKKSKRTEDNQFQVFIFSVSVGKHNSNFNEFQFRSEASEDNSVKSRRWFCLVQFLQLWLDIRCWTHLRIGPDWSGFKICLRVTLMEAMEAMVELRPYMILIYSQHSWKARFPDISRNPQYCI